MTDARYQPGDVVRVKSAFPPGHVRTPYFIRGHNGVVDEDLGRFPNPEELAYGRDGMPGMILYRISFKQTDIWPEYGGAANDTMVVDIYEHWLEPTT